MTKPMEPLLTSAEVAEYLQVPLRTLDYWAATSTGPRFVKPGRGRRYARADVEAWLESQKTGGTTP